MAQGQSNLAAAERARGELEVVEARLREALAITVASYGEASSQAAFRTSNLAVVLRERGRLAASWDLTEVLVEMGETELAIGRLRDDLHDLRASRPAGDDELTMTALRLGLCLARSGHFDEAESLVRERCEAKRDAHGPEDPRTREAHEQLALLYQRAGCEQDARTARDFLGRREAARDPAR